MDSEKNKDVNICIVALMGLPGSGKTTFTEELVGITNKIPHSLCLVLRYDDFVPVEVQKSFPQVQGAAKIARKNFVLSILKIARSVSEQDTDADPDVETALEELVPLGNIRNKCRQFVRNIQSQLRENVIKNMFLVIDDNNYYQSMRNDIYQVAKQLNTSFCVLYMTCPLPVAMERNSKRPEGERVPAEVIQEMIKKLEEPDPISNPCDLFCIQIDSSSAIDDSLKSSMTTLLAHSLLNPVIPTKIPDRTDDRRKCSENEIHQADIVLRKWVNSQLTISSFTTHNSVQARKNRSNELITIKSVTLEKLRTGEYTITSRVDQDVDFHKEIVALAQRTIA